MLASLAQRRPRRPGGAVVRPQHILSNPGPPTRLTVGIAPQRFNVDAFMKSRVNNSGAGFERVAHKTVPATFPRRRFFSSVVAIDVLVEIRAAVFAKKSVVLGRQRKIDNISRSLRRHFKARDHEHGKCCQERSHRRFQCFLSPIMRQSFFMRAMSSALSPEAR